VDIIDIILCSVSSVTKDELKDILKKAEEMGIQFSPRIQKVSRWPAYTTRQAAEFNSLWPTTLRKDSTRVIKISTDELEIMTTFMRHNISLSMEKRKESPGDLLVSAILVDSRTSKILLTAHDTRVSTSHPLNHAIMNLLNKLPSLLPAEVSLVRRNEDDQYYASMYDVYITHEPCTMCCMALVHSRIRRLIFWQGTATGAREIGWMKGDDIDGLLNHRFLSFEGIPGALGEEIEVEQLSEDTYA
jgi:tRNA-specific adenosine deaminase 3